VLEEDTFIRVIVEVCKSIICHGFNKIFILNGHGGNSAALRIALSKIRSETNALVVAADYWILAKDELSEIRESEYGGINHGGEMETSLQLALKPDLVDMKKAKKVMPPISSYIVRDLLGPKKVYRPLRTLEITKSGNIGDATIASVEKGREMLERIVDAVARFIRHFNSVSSYKEL